MTSDADRFVEATPLRAGTRNRGKLEQRPRRSSVGIDPKANSIGFLRLVFALLVIVGHVFPIGGVGRDPLLILTGQEVLQGVGVYGFFVLSGYLIAASSERSGSISRFMWHRVLRIFPGYWVCLIVTALLFAPAMWLAEHGSLDGFLAAGPLSFVGANAGLFLNQLGLPGLLEQRPVPSTLNGSLWTLSTEFLCYIVLGITAFFGLLRPRVAMATVAVIGLLVIVSPIDVRTSAYFVIGAAAYLWRDRVALDDGRIAPFAALLLALSVVIGQYHWLALLPFSYLVLFAAARLPFHGVGRRYDLSYGVYVYAFPTQQLLGILGLPALGIIPYLALTLAVVLPLAFASWLLVEAPALRLKSWQPNLRSGFSRAVS